MTPSCDLQVFRAFLTSHSEALIVHHIMAHLVGTGAASPVSLYNLTLQSPTAINCAIFGNFSKPKVIKPIGYITPAGLGFAPRALLWFGLFVPSLALISLCLRLGVCWSDPCLL